MANSYVLYTANGSTTQFSLVGIDGWINNGFLKVYLNDVLQTTGYSLIDLATPTPKVQFASALQEALQNDPSGTLELLSQHYGVNKQPTSEEEEFLDPVEKQYRQLESRIQAFEQEKAMRELENQIESLSRRYGELFDANEVVAKALATGSTNLEATYKQIAFDRLFEQSRSKEAVTKMKSDETKKIVEAKRDAAVVSKGASAKSADVSSKPIRSVRDAFESAKRQLEG